MARQVRTIHYSTQFARAYRKLPTNLRRQAEAREAWFRADASDPRLKTHKLRGRFAGFWSFSISYSYRIIFTFEKDGVVVFHDVGDHRVYQ